MDKYGNEKRMFVDDKIIYKDNSEGARPDEAAYSFRSSLCRLQGIDANKRSKNKWRRELRRSGQGTGRKLIFIFTFTTKLDTVRMT